ncbi:transposase [Candidatus Parcubacteria bacterium]|nr:transposase [Patescibacteria group bacterium]MBU4381231.1 transposase [Patescibacteria group bacterium]MCG2689263.1 transposase [Candidatus Parcubacteria bacterium]
MPRKNILKKYQEGSYYHIYSRGIFHQDIFETSDDYAIFLYNLKKYLQKDFKEPRFNKVTKLMDYFSPNSVADEVGLVAYCLMPNHFHLLLHNKEIMGISHLTRRILSNYSTYFNTTRGKDGHVFESTYKAVLVRNEDQLKHLSRYIHINPLKLGAETDVLKYAYSSISDYLGETKRSWLYPSVVLSNTSDYKSFVLDYLKSPKESLEYLGTSVLLET